ncbi:T9SS C-terminal target domain-containing protein [candidate division KSB1 bacterium]|nr:MAG: T9SS C-terminal target domain-containing protein [candidate division KSB1 bacterium]
MMTKQPAIRIWSAALLLCSVLAFVPSMAQADPRLWGPDGIVIRQGLHIEWQRAAYRRADGYVLIMWSDTRGGDRDIYGQLLSPNGVQMWESGGIPIVTAYQRQEDPDIIAADGGWVVAWSDFRSDTAGDIWAQKINDNGQPLWTPGGVVVDQFISTVNELTVRIVHDGAGGAIIAWEDTRRGDEADIYAQRVLSNGARAWADPVAVTNEAGGQKGITADTDFNGGMVIAWDDSRIDNDDNIYAARVTPDGQLPWGQNGVPVCIAAGRQEKAKLCPDGLGGCYVAWVDQRSGSSDAASDVYIQHITAGGTPQMAVNGMPLSNAPNGQSEVRIAVSLNSGLPDGCLAVWEDGRLGLLLKEIYTQKVNLNGTVAWGVNGLNTCGGSEYTRRNARLTSDQSGGMICAWEDTRNSMGDWGGCDLYASRIRNDGTIAWTGYCGINVAAGVGQQFQPVIRMDSGDGVFIVYSDTRNGSQSIRYQNLDLSTGALTLDPGGVEIVYGLDKDCNNPKTIAMTPGKVAVVWKDDRYVWGGSGLFYQIVDSAGHIYKRMNGDTLAPDNQGYPEYKQEKHQLCADGNDGFFVSFEDNRTGIKQIRVSHVGSDGNVADGLAGRVVFNDPTGGDQFDASIAPDGQNGCYISMASTDINFNIDAYVVRLDAASNPTWTQPVRLTTAETEDLPYGISVGTDGCAYVATRSGSQDQHDIFLAKVCRDGSVSWNVTVCNALNDQDAPTVLEDGQGGAYVVWTDNRSGTATEQNFDIYAQRINSSGQALWTANGLPIIVQPYIQSLPALSKDSENNLYIVWRDFRNAEDLSLFGQKVSPAGALLWPTEGKPIPETTVNQDGQALLSDPCNGLYVVWSDNRGRFAEIYGMHYSADGLPTDPWWSAQTAGIICDAWEAQLDPSMAADGAGGAIAAWVDQRSSGKEPLRNIWGNRINDRVCQLHAVDVGGPVPNAYKLEQNFPNPFNPSTTFEFSLPRSERVELTVFNLSGQRVATLVDEVLNAGKYQILYDAGSLGSGVYFYRIKTARFSDVKKMTLIR